MNLSHLKPLLKKSYRPNYGNSKFVELEVHAVIEIDVEKFAKEKKRFVVIRDDITNAPDFNLLLKVKETVRGVKK